MLPLKYLVGTLPLVSVLWRFLVLLSCTALHMPSWQILKRTCFESFVLDRHVENQSYVAKKRPLFHNYTIFTIQALVRNMKSGVQEEPGGPKVFRQGGEAVLPQPRQRLREEGRREEF